MWSEVTPEDTELLERWCLIIRQVNPHYLRMDTNELLSYMDGVRGCTWHYHGGGFEIAMRYHYLAKRDEYQLASVGFLGEVEPKVALDLAVEQCQGFLQERQQTYVISLRPKHNNGPHMERFFQLVPQHPDLAVEVVEQWRDMVMWKVILKKLLPEAANEALLAETLGG